MKKVNLGLDVGITSVGWAVLDTDFKILKHGVRLFEKMENGTANELLNKERREKRSLRRQKNRKITRKNDFIKWLNQIGWINIEIDPGGHFRYTFIKKYIENNKNPFDLRKKGVDQKLSKEELIKVLYFYLGLRGYRYEDTKKDDDEKNYKSLEGINYKSNIPIKIQSSYFEKYGFYRFYLNRKFHSQNYEKEIRLILKNSDVDEKITNSYVNSFFKRQRSYEQGPLSDMAAKKMKDKSLLSKYSRFSLDDETGKLEVKENMWQDKIGKCTYFQEEDRINKRAFSAEIFNLLNDLNNLKIGLKEQKLETEDKMEIIKLSLQSKSNINSCKKYLCKKYDITENEIDGFRISRSKKAQKALFTELASYHLIKKIDKDLINADNLIKNNFINDEVHKINKIIEILSFSSIVEKRKKYFENLNYLKPKLIELLSRREEKFTETHSLSLKAIEEMLPFLVNETKNQQQIAYKNGWKSSSNLDLKNKKYIPLGWIDNDNYIVSPTTKRAVRQALKVINKIIKLHKDWQFENVVIEMARDLNGKSKKESERRLMDYLTKRKKSIKDVIEAVQKNTKRDVSGRALVKLWLYEQQKGFDAYTGEKLDRNKVILSHNYADIDHIIPVSHCFDDSINNKVLTRLEHNSKKANRQPFQYLGEEKLNTMSKRWQDWYVSEAGDNSREEFIALKKYKNLMDLTNYSDPANTYDFIGRNLVDTRGATKKILEVLKDFASQQEDEKSAFYKTKVKTINGKLTSIFRKMIDTKNVPLIRPDGLADGSFDEKTGKKDRIWNGHHAEDAVIVVHSALKNMQLNKYIEKVSSEPFMSRTKIVEFAKKEIGNKWKSSNFNNIIDFAFIRNSLNEKVDDVRFSYMLNKKNNLKLFDESTYSSKNLKMNGDKEEKIYMEDNVSFEDIILKNKKIDDYLKILTNEKFYIPMRKHDPKTFKTILDALKNSDSNKPLENKYDEKNRFIINKNGKKRYISKIRYYGTKKESNEIIFLKNQNSNDENNHSGFKKQLNWFATEVFKDEKGKNYLIALNALNCKILKGNIFKYKKEYFRQLKEKKITKDMLKTTIYYGSIIEDLEGKLWRVCGQRSKISVLEIKALFKITKSSERNQFTINKKMKGWILVEIDELGNNFHSKFIF